MRTATPFKAFAALLTCGLVYGSFGVWVRYLSQSFTPFEQIFLRNMFALVIAAVVLLLMRTSLDYRTLPKRDLLFFSILFPLVVILFTFAVTLMKVATAVFIFYASSLVASYVIGVKFFHDPITARKNTAMACSLVGLWFFAYPFEVDGAFWGGVLMLVAGGIDAISFAFRKKLSDKASALSLMPLPLLAGLVINAVLILLSNQPVHIDAMFNLPTIGVLVIFGSNLVLINVLTLYGLRHFDINLGTIVLSSELLFALAFGFFLLGESPTTLEIVGGACVALAIIIANWPKRSPSLISS
ncbi:MAG TPA: DMT family transporter [Candidatus Woesebacteria bacterium]|nr:DMT family transporter [Candidatus Woesebacteria bacterium]